MPKKGLITKKKSVFLLAKLDYTLQIQYGISGLDRGLVVDAASICTEGRVIAIECGGTCSPQQYSSICDNIDLMKIMRPDAANTATNAIFVGERALLLK